MACAVHFLTAPALIACFALIAAEPAQAGKFTFTDLFPGATVSVATAINDAGKVVGSVVASGSNELFVFDKGQVVLGPSGDYAFTALNKSGVAGCSPCGFGGAGRKVSTYNTDTMKVRSYNLTGIKPEKQYVAVTGVSDSGALVGTIRPTRKNKTQSFLYLNGQTTLLPIPASYLGTFATAINSSNTVVGYWQLGGGGFDGIPFSYSAGTYTTILPDGFWGGYIGFVTNSNILGGALYPYGNVLGTGFTYKDGNFSYYSFDNYFTRVVGVGPGGEVVGIFNASDNFNSLHGFVYVSGAYHQIDVPSSFGQGTEIVGVNASGTIIGNYYTGDGPHAFVGTCPVNQAPCTQ